MQSWLPPYTFRRSARAKRLSLRIDPVRGLEVVLPKRVSEKQGFSFLVSQRAWIERHFSTIMLQQRKEQALSCPDYIFLPGINKKFQIEYVRIKTAAKVSLAAHDERLVFYGNIADFHQCVPALIKWLKIQAKAYLPGILDNISKECGLSYLKVGVRAQKTLWGSCSSDHSIQLNYKLIMLPQKVMRYVMIHELCHTVHLNHAKSFWALVKKNMPDYHECEKLLKSANQLLPVWLG